MAEGGMYPWKMQKIKIPPTANYRTMALGEPPAGWEWIQNATSREWTLREREVMAAAVVHEDDDDHPLVEQLNDNHNTMADDGTIPLAHAEPIVEQSNDAPRHHHVVTESDTFQGLCLKYKITATQLRQANCFSGTNLTLAPKILKIPHVVHAQPATTLEMMQQQQQSSLHSSQENKIALVLQKSRGGAGGEMMLKRNEVRAYLEMSDWNVESALDEIRADRQFELLQQQQPGPKID
jgi:hypothetical protein